jgi:hypothetical protein
MKLSSFLLFAFIFTSAQAAIVKSYDHLNQCTLYQVVPSDEEGRVILQRGQRMHFPKNVYGMSFRELQVDFDSRKVTVTPVMNIVFGFNRPLVKNRANISEGNPNFNFLINQLNRSLSLFEKMCISSSSEVVYANFYEPKDPKPSSNTLR